MYVPQVNLVDESATREMVAAYGAGELITTGLDGYPLATLLPVLWDGDRVVAHMARANDHWRTIEPESPCLLVVGGPQAYISPNWYAAKAEHGRVVPTWNYSSVHVRGQATIHDDLSWVRRAVTRLTETHESRRPAPWQVTDAPPAYIDAMLRSIVGVEVVVVGVEGKAKLSQNRSEEDRRRVIEELGTDHPVAAAMAATLTS